MDKNIEIALKVIKKLPKKRNLKISKKIVSFIESHQDRYYDIKGLGDPEIINQKELKNPNEFYYHKISKSDFYYDEIDNFICFNAGKYEDLNFVELLDFLFHSKEDGEIDLFDELNNSKLRTLVIDIDGAKNKENISNIIKEYFKDFKIDIAII
ncbi:MAG: hypothetical protein E7273_10595 [Pseudobutyrivibrio ruminis]|nr:hypothetical protein [Pseudobutyrivibrio ruminis]